METVSADQTRRSYAESFTARGDGTAELVATLRRRLDLLLVALRDRRLSRQTMRVYAVLMEGLATDAFQPVKQTWLVKRLHLKRQAVGRSIKVLLELGYVERDHGADDGRQFRYRLVTPRCTERPAA